MKSKGFTLIELMIVVMVLGILASIGIARYQNMSVKATEASTKGNLGRMRSALSIYYGDNEQTYPRDNLDSLAAANKYIDRLPTAKLPLTPHVDIQGVTPESAPTDTGRWSYNNDDSSLGWGALTVGCLHADTHGTAWSAY